MADTIKKEISIKVIATVVSTLILAALALVLKFVPGVWYISVEAFSWVLNAKFLTPVWILFPLIISAGILILVVLKNIHFETDKNNEGVLDWRNYVSDNFFGMKWRWSWSNGSLVNLWSFCLSDDTTLVFREHYFDPTPSMILGGRGVIFHCETCGREFGPFTEDEKSLSNKAKRQIDRKLRTNEWQSEVSPALAHG
jgi:hypothetical protein